MSTFAWHNQPEALAGRYRLWSGATTRCLLANQKTIALFPLLDSFHLLPLFEILLYFTHTITFPCTLVFSYQSA
jgi:hypothetical protein